MSHLEALGWAASTWTPRPGLEPARVVSQQRGRLQILTDTVPAHGMLRGALLDDPPVVGDWVAVRMLDEGQAIVEEVLPRRTLLQRRRAGGGPPQRVAANVDVVVVVTALDQDFSPRRIERYVAIARGAGAEPVVVLSKPDRARQRPARRGGRRGARP